MEALNLMPEILFYIISGMVLVSSVMVVASRNPITSAIFLVVDLFFVAALYASLGADFTAAVQVLVYAGAIVVLFVFVIMLLNLKPEALRGFRFTVGEALVLLITLTGFVIIATELAHAPPDIASPGNLGAAAIELAGGNTFVVGMRMFTAFLWPFEIASVLILLAIVACVMVAKKDKKSGLKGHIQSSGGN